MTEAGGEIPAILSLTRASLSAILPPLSSHTCYHHGMRFSTTSSRERKWFEEVCRSELSPTTRGHVLNPRTKVERGLVARTACLVFRSYSKRVRPCTEAELSPWGYTADSPPPTPCTLHARGKGRGVARSLRPFIKVPSWYD